MFSFFNRKTTAQLSPALPYLDSALYPLNWQQHSFESAPEFLQHLINHLSFEQPDIPTPHIERYTASSLVSYQKQFSQLLLQHPFIRSGLISLSLVAMYSAVLVLFINRLKMCLMQRYQKY